MQLDVLAPSPGKEPVPQMWRLMLIDAASDEAEMAADILASRMKTMLGIKPANGPIISSKCPVILDAILAAVEPGRAEALATRHGVALSVLPILKTRLESSELERAIGFEREPTAKPERLKARR